MLNTFVLFAIAYFFSYGMRTVNAAISPQLMADLGLSYDQLGLISAAYFIGFTVMQLPLGVALDRFGGRRVEAILLCIAALGCLLFAIATDFYLSLLARGLIGLGFAAALMAPFHCYRLWFGKEVLRVMATAMLGVGTLGVLGATLPVKWFLLYFDWRSLFLLAAVFLLLSALGLVVGLKKIEAAHRLPVRETVDWGWRDIFTHPAFLYTVALGVFIQGGFIALQSLWLGPWLEAAGVDAASYLFIFNAGLLFAYFLLSVTSHRLPTRYYYPVTVGMMALGIFLLLLIAVLPLEPTIWLPLWLGFFICATVGILVQADLAPRFPAAISGRVNTAYNMVIFSGAFVIQAGGGVVLQYFLDHGFTVMTGLRASFLVLVGAQGVALWFYHRGFRPGGRASV